MKIINKSKHPLPKYQTELSSGMDLYANLDEEHLIHGGMTTVIPTGIHIQVPKGYEGQVRTRSGMAAKKLLVVANSPGTIDADYTGEIKVILHNNSEFTKVIKDGDRIAQLVICPIKQIILEEVEEFDETERGERGFGSTGF